MSRSASNCKFYRIWVTFPCAIWKCAGISRNGIWAISRAKFHNDLANSWVWSNNKISSTINSNCTTSIVILWHVTISTFVKNYWKCSSFIRWYCLRVCIPLSRKIYWLDVIKIIPDTIHLRIRGIDSTRTSYQRKEKSKKYLFHKNWVFIVF